MRRGTMGTRLRVLLGTAAFVIMGCPGQELAALSPCTVSAVSTRVDQAGISDVDLLFMIDNSGSMANKQARLARELPRLLEVLTKGDRCAGGNEDNCKYDDESALKRTFTAVKKLHVGVVTSNMGGIDNPPERAQEAIRACAGHGDDGLMQNSVEVAVQGVFAQNDTEFSPVKKGEPVIEPDPTCALDDVPLYQEYDADDPDSDPALVANNFRCVARVGVRGCPFEQQLEAAWKAVAPSDGKGETFEFLDGSRGHGGADNGDFLRDDAILAVVLVTDEDDCSITDAGKSLLANTSDPRINMLCGENADNPELVRDTRRYLRGFQSLKPNNTERIIFAAITGVPEEAVAANLTLDEILQLPEMQFTEDPSRRDFPKISCANKTNPAELAYPPRRIVQVAKDFGNEGIVYSVCADDYAPALDLLIEKIANKLKGNCLPRKLIPKDGLVNCQVFELLPDGVNECDPAQGLKGKVEKRTVVEDGKRRTRNACEMSQIKVMGEKPGEGQVGWYYDDFSKERAEECGDSDAQRISFQFARGNDLPSGAGATFECFAPVARIDNDAKGFDAINTRCSEAGNECAARSNAEDNGYDLLCIDSTCQVTCEENPDCPPAWVCSAKLDGSSKTKFCQLPTCPADESQQSPAAADAG